MSTTKVRKVKKTLKIFVFDQSLLAINMVILTAKVRKVKKALKILVWTRPY